MSRWKKVKTKKERKKERKKDSNKGKIWFCQDEREVHSMIACASILCASFSYIELFLKPSGTCSLTSCVMLLLCCSKQ